MNIAFDKKKVQLSTLNEGELFIFGTDIFLRVTNKFIQPSETQCQTIYPVVNLSKNKCDIFYDIAVVPINGTLVISNYDFEYWQE